MEEECVTRAAGSEVEVGRSGFHGHSFFAVVPLEKPGDGAGGSKVTHAARNLVQDRAIRPPRAVEIRSGGYLHSLTVALVKVHHPGVVNACEPLKENRI